MKPKIAGVLSLKNAISQGYPFLESIYSFLSFGDELFIEDGESSDGTLEILEEISKNKKIKLFSGYKWLSVSKKGHAIRDAYNHVLKKVKDYYQNKQGVYLMQVQANEIIPEENYRYIKLLPNIYPYYIGFYLPYQFMVGSYMVNNNDWRLRIIRADQDPLCYGDAGEIYPKRELSFSKFLKITGTATFRYATRRLYYSHVYFKTALIYLFVPLPKPIFRYTYVFPSNVINKIKGHSKLYSGSNDYKAPGYIPSFIEELSKKKIYNNKFYSLLANNICSRGITRMSARPILISQKSHPRIMQKIINSNKYITRSEIVEKIKKL